MGSVPYLWEATDAIFESMRNKPWWGKSCIINYAFHKGFEPANREGLKKGLPKDPYNTLARRFEKCYLPGRHETSQPTGQGHLNWESVVGLVRELEASGETACDIAATVKDCLPRDSTNPKYMQIMKAYSKFKERQASSTSNGKCKRGQAHDVTRQTMSSNPTSQNMADNIRKRMFAQKSNTLAVSRSSTPEILPRNPDIAEMRLQFPDDSQPEFHAQREMLPGNIPVCDPLTNTAPIFAGFDPNTPSYFPVSASSGRTGSFQSLEPDMEAIESPSYDNHPACSDWTRYSIGGVSDYMTKEQVEDEVVSRFQDLNISKADMNMRLTENETKLGIELPIHKF